MNVDKQVVYMRVKKEVETEARKMYRKIVSPLYTAPIHIESLVTEWKRKQAYEDIPVACVAYIDQVFSFMTETDLDQNERRLNDFTWIITRAFQQHLSPDWYKNSRNNFLIEMILTRYSQAARDELSPWTQLFAALQRLAPFAQLKKMETQLTEIYPVNDAAKSATLVYTDFLVRLGHEQAALRHLQEGRQTIDTQDVVGHIEQLSKRLQYTFVKQWLSMLFPRQTKHLGELQLYADQAEVALQPCPEETCTKVWHRFVQNPSERAFVMLVKPLTSEQTTAVLDKILPQLRARLFSDAVRKVYVQLLYRYSRYHEAVTYFLIDENQPLVLSEVKKALLKAAAEQFPTAAKPIYHQLIVRFAEKRSRKHYVEAADYAIQLRSLYEATGDVKRYEYFLMKLKEMYQTSRAFIEELNRRV